MPGECTLDKFEYEWLPVNGSSRVSFKFSFVRATRVQACFLVDFSFTVRTSFTPPLAVNIFTFGVASILALHSTRSERYDLDHAPAVVVCGGRSFEPRGKLEIVVTEASASAFLQREASLLAFKQKFGHAEIGRLPWPQTVQLENHVDLGLYCLMHHKPAVSYPVERATPC